MPNHVGCINCFGHCSSTCNFLEAYRANSEFLIVFPNVNSTPIDRSIPTHKFALILLTQSVILYSPKLHCIDSPDPPLNQFPTRLHQADLPSESTRHHSLREPSSVGSNCHMCRELSHNSQLVLAGSRRGCNEMSYTLPRSARSPFVCSHCVGRCESATNLQPP